MTEAPDPQPAHRPAEPPVLTYFPARVVEPARLQLPAGDSGQRRGRRRPAG